MLSSQYGTDSFVSVWHHHGNDSGDFQKPFEAFFCFRVSQTDTEAVDGIWHFFVKVNIEAAASDGKSCFKMISVARYFSNAISLV